MQNLEELEKMFLEKIRPYEERMKQLEDIERENNIEIATLKNAIQSLNKTIDQLKLKAPVSSKTTRGTLLPLEESKCFFYMCFFICLSALVGTGVSGGIKTVRPTTPNSKNFKKPK
jgi:hypothetical protein